ncbi:hypothetical protein [Desulfosporosinus burensis]
MNTRSTPLVPIAIGIFVISNIVMPKNMAAIRQALQKTSASDQWLNITKVFWQPHGVKMAFLRRLHGVYVTVLWQRLISVFFPLAYAKIVFKVIMNE